MIMRIQYESEFAIGDEAFFVAKGLIRKGVVVSINLKIEELEPGKIKNALIYECDSELGIQEVDEQGVGRTRAYLIEKLIENENK